MGFGFKKKPENEFLNKKIVFFCPFSQGGSMPNTSSSVPFLLTSSMQSIRSRRTSTCLSSGPLGSGSGLLQQIGSGMVRQLGYGGSGSLATNKHHANTFSNTSINHYNGNLNMGGNSSDRRNNLTQYNSVRKCPSLNITFSS